jgi:hypothetical protein
MHYSWPSLIARFQTRYIEDAKPVDRYLLVNRLMFLSQYLKINKIYVYAHNYKNV